MTPQTAAVYRSAAAAWFDWLQSRFDNSPPEWNATLLLCFLADIKEQGWSFSRANLVRSFVQKENTARGKPDLARSQTVDQFMRGYQRSVPSLQSRMPLRQEDLDKFTRFVYTTELPYIDQRAIIWMSALAYYGCLRMSEVLGLRIRDFSFTNTGMQIWIQKSKNWPNGVAVQLQYHDPMCPTPPRFFSAIRGSLNKVPVHGNDITGVPIFKERLRQLANDTIGRCFPKTTRTFYSFHSWRHGRVTDLYSKMGGSHTHRLDVIAKFGKWKCRSTVSIYLHIENESGGNRRSQGSRGHAPGSGQTAK